MKLLIIAQSVDRNNTVLGFFHQWIAEFAKRFEYVTVICLEKGDYDLPSNVKVLSLGKEDKKIQDSRFKKIKYLRNFYRFIWQERENYDVVFVHMNQEYIFLGWKLWWLLRKRIYLWRNHHAGSFFTDMAAMFCAKVFCTSKFSYTAKYKKTVIMPIGVDMDVFRLMPQVVRKPRSILFLARMAPVKKPDMLIETLRVLSGKGVEYTACFYGDPSEKDREYYLSLKETVKRAGLGECIRFEKGVPNSETPKIYNAFDICVNLSSSGMYDKTIIEAMACGCLTLASNENLRGKVDPMFIFKEGDSAELQRKLGELLDLPLETVVGARIRLRAFAETHGLFSLMNHLQKEMQKK